MSCNVLVPSDCMNKPVYSAVNQPQSIHKTKWPAVYQSSNDAMDRQKTHTLQLKYAMKQNKSLPYGSEA